MTTYPIRLRLFTRAEYGRLIEAGIFRPGNLLDRVLEVYRDPIQDPAARLGWRHAWTEVLSSGSSAAPLVAPGTRIRVADLPALVVRGG